MSLLLLTLIPTPPVLGVHPPLAEGSVVLQLQGQVDVPYILQSFTNLASWTLVSTNVMTNSTPLLTNAVASTPRIYWRAAWLP